MLEFYKKAIVVFFGLVVLTALIGYICIENFLVNDPLLPLAESVFPWEADTISDTQDGGSSSVAITDTDRELAFSYTITKDLTYPYVSVVLRFKGTQTPGNLVNLKKYSRLSFKVRCARRNLLSFNLHSLDPNITDPTDFASYRIAFELFSCSNKESEVQIDLQHMRIPMWWLEGYKVELSDQDYWLDKTVAFTFGASRQGPVNMLTDVTITDLTLQGHEWRYIILFGVSSLLIWGGYLFWLLRGYTTALVADVKERLLKDRPLIAYQQLSIEPHRDKEKNQVLRFMATQYPNPQLSLEMAISELGVSRTRINDILKTELGLTFSSYLNRLRLSEAARLLSERDEANIAEIAYSVGYNNVSYFNRLFKNEYGCTPKTFKNIYQKEKGG